MVFILSGLKFLINDYRLILEWYLLSFNSISISYIIYLDWISIVFSFVVFFVSSIVILYRKFYIGDYNYSSLRFLILVLLFVFRILLIILRPNLIRILLGWDGLGLVSYCLVIYYMSLRRYLAGIITCLVNRLGDIGLLISVGWIFRYGRWNFIYYLNFYTDYSLILVVISSFTRRAQIPFSMWLPAAIAAPTPVSALVHSSTLVTAGVYLLIRFYNYRFISGNLLFLSIRIFTILMSSFCAIFEFDLKKIIAFSTLRQLGLIMSCLFLGFKDFSFFHILSHAMFKSLLFLCSGIIIHLMSGCQDIRIIGSICLTIPVTCSCFNISNIALFGFPFLSGFYSKDLIIEFSSFAGLNFFLIVILYVSLGLTSFYRIRLIYYTILIKFNYLSFLILRDDISLIKYRIVFLSLFSISFGSIYLWLTNLDMSFIILPLYLRILTLIIVLLGFWLGYELSLLKYSYTISIINGTIWFIRRYLNSFYHYGYSFGLKFNQGLYWGEFFGGLGLSYYILKISSFFQIYSLGSIKLFFIRIIVWLIFLL